MIKMTPRGEAQDALQAPEGRAVASERERGRAGGPVALATAAGKAEAGSRPSAPWRMLYGQHTVDPTPSDAETLRDRRGSQLGPQLPDLRRIVRSDCRSPALRHQLPPTPILSISCSSMIPDERSAAPYCRCHDADAPNMFLLQHGAGSQAKDFSLGNRSRVRRHFRRRCALNPICMRFDLHFLGLRGY
jgi:hypothetical protein